MKVLLDAHTLIWAFDDPFELSSLAKSTILDSANDRYFSMASAWEIAIKVAGGKRKLSLPYRDWVLRALNDLNADLIPIDFDHADAQMKLVLHHRDAFDRLLIAQSIVENMPIISIGVVFDAYSIRRIW